MNNKCKSQIDMTLPLDWIGREMPLRSRGREKRTEVGERGVALLFGYDLSRNGATVAGTS